MSKDKKGKIINGKGSILIIKSSPIGVGTCVFVGGEGGRGWGEGVGAEEVMVSSN